MSGEITSTNLPARLKLIHKPARNRHTTLGVRAGRRQRPRVKEMLASPSTAVMRHHQRGTRSPICSNTTASVKTRTSWRVTRAGRPESALSVASEPTSRCGCVNTPVRSVAPRRTHRLRSETLRITACGDCACCGQCSCVCKARSPDSVWWAVRRSLTTSWKQELPSARSEAPASTSR